MFAPDLLTPAAGFSRFSRATHSETSDVIHSAVSEGSREIAQAYSFLDDIQIERPRRMIGLDERLVLVVKSSQFRHDQIFRTRRNRNHVSSAEINSPDDRSLL